MAKPKNAMEIFQVLDKSNCGQCGEKTCLAFAGAVFTGRLGLDLCPKLDPETLRRFAPEQDDACGMEDRGQDAITKLKQRIAGIDLAEAAARTGGRLENGRLILKVMGKDFGVDGQGNLFADIHVNPWVAAPVLDYILNGRGEALAGEWAPFRELKGGAERNPLFHKRCEEALKRVADTYTDLFDDLVHMFGGKQVAPQFKSDISVILYPLPKVPMMVCYWKPEDGLGSNFHLFFDRSAEANLSIGSVFNLATGFAYMLFKLVQRHGVSASTLS